MAKKVVMSREEAIDEFKRTGKSWGHAYERDYHDTFWCYLCNEIIRFKTPVHRTDLPAEKEAHQAVCKKQPKPPCIKCNTYAGTEPGGFCHRCSPLKKLFK